MKKRLFMQDTVLTDKGNRTGDDHCLGEYTDFGFVHYFGLKRARG